MPAHSSAEYLQKWRADNCQHVKDYALKWRLTNKEYVKSYMQKYRAENKQKSAEQEKQYRQQNHARYQQWWREWDKANPEKVRVKHHKRRARLLGNGGAFTADELSERFEAQEGRCYYCGRLLYASFDRDIHVDHKTPLARGGSNEISNIALACSACNFSKGAKTEEEYLKYEESRRICSI